MAEFAVSTERTLVSGAARIPACTNCCGSGGPLQERVIIRVHREGVSREGPREGLHLPAVHDRATGDLLAEPQELGHGDAVCYSEVGHRSIGPQGSRRYEGEEKKISRTVYWTFAAQVRSHISQSLVESDDPINMRYAFSVTEV